MGKRGPRYNAKARASSRLTATAKPHPAPRDAAGTKPQKVSSLPVNAALPKVEGQEGTAEYSASSTQVPLALFQGQKGTSPADGEDGSSVLLEAPQGKMTSKKRKRLEKFIEKQLKKEERVKLLQKLSEQTFSSELLRSSKQLGRGKLTARERLRQALNEERSGLPISDPDSRLLVEADVEAEAEDEEMQEEIADIQHEDKGAGVEVADTSENKLPAQPSLIALAFGQPSSRTEAASSPEVVVDGFGSALKADCGTVGGFGSGLKKKDDASPPVLGSALKRKATDEGLTTEAKKKKKKQKKKAPVVEEIDRRASSSESDSDVDASGQDEAVDGDSRKSRKSKWASDVIGGETLSAPTVLSAPSVISKSNVAKSSKGNPPRPSKPAFHVPVHRTEAIQTARITLPVVTEEQPIMETILANDVTILCGETGSGKTTQVPQFLYEAGFGDPSHPTFRGIIGITQPRRVAAVSMARRVAEEMNLKGGEVAYQIRYDRGTVTSKTRIKFMTDGILLRELSGSTGSEGEGDLVLSKYSCIIIDEAHERTVGTDVLIGWLTRIVKLRNSGKVQGVGPLKLIIMSATLRVEDFTENASLFPPAVKPPVVKVDGRQHKVVIHYNKRTPDIDYVTEAFKKVSKIHSTLPAGGILVFLTGQQEIQTLVRKLQSAFPVRRRPPASTTEVENETKEQTSDGLFAEEEDGEVEMEAGKDDFDIMEDGSGSEDDEEEVTEVLGGLSDDEDEELQPVFRTPEEERIKYVVDCGKVKERRYDSHTGVQTYTITWASRAAADQRAGRAGRMGPGHCYRLFSSAVFNDYFDQFSRPEMLRVPIEGVVLQMKAMGINQVVGFPFPTPPGKANLKAAEKLLMHLGALDASSPNLKITELGKLMSTFPVSPRFAKMIIVASQQSRDILPYIVAIVAGLSVGDPFIRDEDIVGKGGKGEDDDEEDDDGDDEKERRKKKRGQFYKVMQMFSGDPPTSDALRLLTAIGAYTADSARPNSNVARFCAAHFLRPKAMEEILKLRAQLTNLIKTTLPSSPSVRNLCVNPRMPPPSLKQSAALRQILLAGFADQIAVIDSDAPRGHKNAPPSYLTPWSTKNERFVIHPSSSLFRERPAPKWVIYEEIMGREERMAADNSGAIDLRKSSLTLDIPPPTPGEEGITKFWMKGITVITDTWISNVAPTSLVKMGKLMEQPEPRYDGKADKVLGYITPTYGPKMWELPVKEAEVPVKEGRYAVFAQALMEGGVFGKGKADVFKILVPYLVTKPNTITKSWSKSQPKVLNLIVALATAQIDSRTKLAAKWQADSKFLLKPYLAWIPADLHAPSTKHWPPVSFSSGGAWKPNMALIKTIEDVTKKVAKNASQSSDDGAGESEEDSDF
ncbi:ATP-dependent RNA helicase dhx37 [Borealophlyctis nickersoniae]|nr:ATP-dependent RNA helicase dhx37 [Borealophlyctis nickersoniae]